MAMSDVRDATKEATRAARDIAVEVRNDLPEALRSADAWLRDAAARQPLLTLGAAVVAGYAIGRVLARR
ncbi:MAG TPA: hypothetical protein VNE71_12020 [Myxococcota bacterium]|jgi:hypothetical protein|nr:hypothetical protein [Myxococcota bacterium]